jgi:hypothetical protein
LFGKWRKAGENSGSILWPIKVSYGRRLKMVGNNDMFTKNTWQKRSLNNKLTMQECSRKGGI